MTSGHIYIQLIKARRRKGWFCYSYWPVFGSPLDRIKREDALLGTVDWNRKPETISVVQAYQEVIRREHGKTSSDLGFSFT